MRIKISDLVQVNFPRYILGGIAVQEGDVGICIGFDTGLTKYRNTSRGEHGYVKVHFPRLKQSGFIGSTFLDVINRASK